MINKCSHSMMHTDCLSCWEATASDAYVNRLREQIREIDPEWLRQHDDYWFGAHAPKE